MLSQQKKAADKRAAQGVKMMEREQEAKGAREEARQMTERAHCYALSVIAPYILMILSPVLGTVLAVIFMFFLYG